MMKKRSKIVSGSQVQHLGKENMPQQNPNQLSLTSLHSHEPVKTSLNNLAINSVQDPKYHQAHIKSDLQKLDRLPDYSNIYTKDI